MSTFYGKYRGLVTDIQDPLMLGRIKAQVPDVMGSDDSGGAMPCAPFGGSQAGFFALPVVGAGVWIEFEHGDPDYPIWAGSWWGAASDLPAVLLSPPYKKVILQTPGGNTVIIDDSPGVGGITLQTSGGQKIVLNPQGIVIDNGMGAKIELQGATVSVNGGALQVI